VLTSPLGRAGVLNRYMDEDELKKRKREKESARVARVKILYESLGTKLPIIRGGRRRRGKETSKNDTLFYALKYLITLKKKASESEDPLQQIQYSTPGSNYPTALGGSCTSSLESYSSLSSESGSEYQYVHTHPEQVSFNFY